MSVRALSLVMVSLLPAAVVAAPAPLPKPIRSTAEAVFDARTTERTRLALLWLRSDALVVHLADADEVVVRLSHLNEDQRRDWLRKRLRVSADGTRVRVRIDGESASLAVLCVLADRLTGVPYQETVVNLRGVKHRYWNNLKSEKGRKGALAVKEEYTRRLAAMKRLNESKRGRVPDSHLRETEATLARYELEIDPLKLHSGAPDSSALSDSTGLTRTGVGANANPQAAVAQEKWGKVCR